MKRLICIVMVLAVVFSLCACSDSIMSSDANLKKDFDRSENIAQYDFLSEEHTTPENYEKYAEGLVDFGIRLLAENMIENENAVVSPVSASAVLGTLAVGASGKTSAEIRNTIASGANTDVISTGTHYLFSRLTAFNNDEGYFKSANSLWFDNSFDVKSSFLQTCTNYYDTDIFRIDFTEVDAADKVNGWVKEKTDGEIEKILDSVDGACTVAINTALLEDAWTTPYEDFQMSEGTFYGAKGDAQAQFMTSNEFYLSTSYAEGFVKGFKNVPCKFMALLPKEGESIEAFVKNLSADRLTAIIDSQAPMERCIAKLPVFSMESDLELTESLKAMGINTLFDAEKADFSNLSNAGKVYVSEVNQKTFVEVGAQGAKAGAASSAFLSAGAFPSQEEIEFKELNFDRPFVFVIYDNESYVPAFIGIVNNVD